MKMLMILPLIFLTSCTCLNFQTEKMSGWYCSSKDIKGLELKANKNDGIDVRLNSAENEFKEALEKSIDAFMLKKKKQKDMLEALKFEN